MPILILAFLSFIYYLVASLLLYLSLHSNAWDLGVFNQVLFNTAHGHLFAYSFRPFGNYLGDHFSPILLILSPLTLLRTSIPLLFIQALVLSLAVFVLYKLAREIIGGNLLPLAVAFAFAFNPFTLQIVNFDFHPDSFFPLLFFASVYVVVIELKKKTSLQEVFFSKLWVFIILLQLVREDAFLLILPLAVVSYHYFRQKRLAFWISVLTLIYTIIVLLFVMPKIRGGSSSPLSEHYPYLGRSFGEIVQNILTKPQLILGKLTGPQELSTLTKFFASTGFLSFFSPVILIASAPIFLAHLLSVVPMRINFQGHYSAEPLTVMFLALIFGLRFLARYSARGSVIHPPDGGSGSRNKFGMTFGRKEFLSLYLVANTAVSFVLFSPLPPSLVADVNRFTINNHTKLFFELKKMIPDDASVSAQTNLVPALAFRREIYEFPDLRKADFVFLDAFGSISGQTLGYGFYQVKDQLLSLGYKLIKDEDGFRIYKRVGP